MYNTVQHSMSTVSKPSPQSTQSSISRNSSSSTFFDQQGEASCSPSCTRPVSVVFLLAFALSLAHIGRSLTYGNQYNNMIQNHYYSFNEGNSSGSIINNNNNNFYFFMLPSSSSNSSNITDLSEVLSPSLWSSSSPSSQSLVEHIMTLPTNWFVPSSVSETESQRMQKHKLDIQQQLQQDSRPFVAIVMCIRSKSEWIHINETSLYTLLIPSIEKTVTQDEWKNYRIELFLGFDAGDRFWENDQHRQLLQSTTAQTLPHLGINFMAVMKKRPTQIPFNAVCRAAYELGGDYIVRINDDTEFLTPNWITLGVQQLNQFHPSQLGVVGPKCDQGNTDILTHDMVHRLHLDIFQHQYYPDEFDNWWIDDWISLVYGHNNTKRIVDWVVQHHIDKHGTRYSVNGQLKQHLEMTLERGRETIQKYIQEHSDGDLRLPKDNITVEVLGSNQIPAAWGPSMNPLYNSSLSVQFT
ncbi:glycosyl transferase family 2 protein [Nitzschia inconspicua]|uniref:Glycosyl transferase family 2 protein n=1 Tax=Nitzschia inconspicua TaxID=303405 RepID=A0A9K3KF77_9STRA|nr:glycosyl transferase family 2 protein [Nitzschia inconspicua]